MRSIMAKFFRAGIAAVLICSLSACAADLGSAPESTKPVKFAIAAHCLRVLSDSFEQPPEIIVQFFESTSHATEVSAPVWFLEEVRRKNVRLGSEHDAKSGISVVAIYLDRIETPESGEVVISFSEVSSLSEKFLHEFGVSMTEGDVKKVVLLRTTKL